MRYKLNEYHAFRVGSILYGLSPEKLSAGGHLVEEIAPGAAADDAQELAIGQVPEGEVAFRVRPRPLGFFPGEEVGVASSVDPWVLKKLSPLEAPAVAETEDPDPAAEELPASEPVAESPPAQDRPAPSAAPAKAPGPGSLDPEPRPGFSLERASKIREALDRLQPGDLTSSGRPKVRAIVRETGLDDLTREEIAAALDAAQ